MARVAVPGAPIVVADENPDFVDIGHRFGLPWLARWLESKVMRMGDEFTGLIERRRGLDVAAIGRRVLKNSRYETIWRGGYMLYGEAP
jgi:hypothetical protein